MRPRGLTRHEHGPANPHSATAFSRLDDMAHHSRSDNVPQWAAAMRNQRLWRAENQHVRSREQTLARAAGQVQLRYCPGCSTPVVKDGGCNSMSCPCGANFSWMAARPVRPCRHCHGNCFEGFSTCDYCSRFAKREAMALAIGSRTLAVPAFAVKSTLVTAGVATAIGVGTAATVMTASVFGPPAVVWECRRRQKGKRPWKGNKVHKAANSGSYVLIGGVLAVMWAAGAIGYDSDDPDD